MATSPQEEAIDIFADVVRAITSRQYDLKALLLRCFHACQLLGLTEARDWFYREAYGYPPDAQLPDYRRIPGRLVWRARGMENQLEAALVDVNYGEDTGESDD